MGFFREESTTLHNLIDAVNGVILFQDFFEGLDNLVTLSMDDCNLNDDSFPKGLFAPLKYEITFISIIIFTEKRVSLEGDFPYTISIMFKKTEKTVLAKQ